MLTIHLGNIAILATAHSEIKELQDIYIKENISNYHYDPR